MQMQQTQGEEVIRKSLELIRLKELKIIVDKEINRFFSYSLYIY